MGGAFAAPEAETLGAGSPAAFELVKNPSLTAVASLVDVGETLRKDGHVVLCPCRADATPAGRSQSFLATSELSKAGRCAQGHAARQTCPRANSSCVWGIDAQPSYVSNRERAAHSLCQYQMHAPVNSQVGRSLSQIHHSAIEPAQQIGRVRGVFRALRGAAGCTLAGLLVMSLVSACSGGGASNSVPVVTYNLGGSVSGLFGTGLVLANGSDTVTVAANAATFKLPKALPEGSPYAVTIATQPAGLTCAVTGGVGTMPKADTNTVEVSCQPIWTWVDGQNKADAAGTYGTLGSAGVGNTPGGRQYMGYWADRNGNLWLMGGLGWPAGGGSAGYLNDLWKFNTRTSQWTWVHGSQNPYAAGVYGIQGQAAPGNMPGARGYMASWVDSKGDFWIFGGFGIDANGTMGNLNDLWRFDVAANQWIWVSGSNAVNAPGVYGTKGTPASGQGPGARSSALAWTDGTGDLWLFGGLGLAVDPVAGGELNDLWKFSPSTGLWTWVHGANAVNVAGVYGTLGTSASGNTPGARLYALAWGDAKAGELWLFGGSGPDSLGRAGDLNDLWRYSLASGQWTWIAGSSRAGAIGVYGTQAQAADGNVPGARMSSTGWSDSAGNLWLFGGFGEDATSSGGGFLNDVWKFDKSSTRWTWISGSKTNQQSGVYGVRGVPSASNAPGGRQYAASWLDSEGSVWLFGGGVWATGGTGGRFNDLWRY